MQSDMTPLDLAQAAMDDAPDDDAARLRFHALLADTEVMVLLAAPAGDDAVAPEVFDLEAGRYVMVFDREERLAAFADAPAPYAALPGRVVIGQLAGQGIGIGLNLGVAPSSYLMTAAAVDWLAATLTQVPVRTEGAIASLAPPAGVPDVVRQALADRLRMLPGLATGATLAAARYADGRRGHLLAVRDAGEADQARIAKAIGEALTFSGVEAGEVDVVFIATGAPLDARIRATGIEFAIPAPVPAPVSAAVAPIGPGMDPARPPRLR